MEQFGRAEVILDGSGYLEEAREVVDVRLEAGDLTWGWESQGLMAEGAVRAYIYFRKADGTVEGEGVEIPFHAVVAPPDSGPEDVQVRVASVQEEHRFDPEERSFSQTIRLELVAEAAAERQPVSGEAPPQVPPQGTGQMMAEGVASTKEAGSAASEVPAPPGEIPGEVSLEEEEREAEPAPQEALEDLPEPLLQETPAAETQTVPEAEPALEPAHALRDQPGAGPGLDGIAGPGPEEPLPDDSVIVWKPFPEE